MLLNYKAADEKVVCGLRFFIHIIRMFVSCSILSFMLY